MESMHSANFPNNLGSSTQQFLTDTDLPFSSGTTYHNAVNGATNEHLYRRRFLKSSNCAVETFGEFSYPFVPHDFVLIQEMIEITYPKESEPNKDCRIYMKPSTVPRGGSRAPALRQSIKHQARSGLDEGYFLIRNRQEKQTYLIGPITHS